MARRNHPYGFLVAVPLSALMAVVMIASSPVAAQETGLIITTKSRVESGVPDGETKESAVSMDFQIATVMAGEGNAPDLEKATTVTSDSEGLYTAILAPGQYWVGGVPPTGQAPEETRPVIIEVEDGQMKPVTLYRSFFAPTVGPGGTDAIPIPDTKSAYDKWVEAHFTTEEIQNTSSSVLITGKSADPDGDLLTNLGEFSFGTDPKQAGSPQVSAQLVEDDKVRLRYHRRAPAEGGLRFVVQTSVNLKDWEPLSQEKVLLEETVSDPSDSAYVDASYLISIGTGKSTFLRIASEE